MSTAPAHGDALHWLLARLDARTASAFVEHELARLAEYDREHGTDLQHVLELALDHLDRSSAAHAAYMHRNTFRRQLRTALGLLGADLERPEERLALHLALKLRAEMRCTVHHPG
jgi:DNA-binding PucR family transcriptional regulator